MAAMGNEKHLRKGSNVPPPPARDVLRVYGMKFCPYVHRLKLVLCAKGVKHETVNIHLLDKLEWYLKKNPLGFVPTLEFNGEIIVESDITAAYIDAAYPGRVLTTTDPLRRAKEAMLLGSHSKTISGFYGYARGDTEEAKSVAFEKLTQGLKALESYFESSGFPFICGKAPGFTDYMIWTHLERVKAVIPHSLKQFGKVQGYFKNMAQDEAVKSCRWSDEIHQKCYSPNKAKEDNPFDFGEVVEYNFSQISFKN